MFFLRSDLVRLGTRCGAHGAVRRADNKNRMGKGPVTSRHPVHPLHRTHRGTPTLQLASLGVAFVVFFFVFPVNAAVAAAESLYLAGTGVPEASLSVKPPSAGTLPNYDPGRDDSPGLTLKKTDEGANEADPTKYQIWIAPSVGVVLDGKASFSFWSAMKDFDESKKGEVEAYLLECAPSGSDCTTIDSGSILRGQWSAGSPAWVARTIQFGSVSHAVPVGRSLAVKVVVGDHSDDDVWFAYGVANYPSLLTITPATTPTTTTTSLPTTTTTTAPPATTTTTTLPTTTTTTTTPPTTTTTTTTPPTTTTTTAPSVGASGASGGQPSSDAPSDITLAALLDPAEAEILRSEINSSITRDFLEGLDLVVSPPIATALLSPFLVLEAFARALSDAGEAMVLPGLLLVFGVLYLSNEARVKALLTRVADPEGEHR